VNQENLLSQDDFSGGVNMVDDPIQLAPNQVAAATNFYIVNKTLAQRGGLVEYNSSSIGATVQVRNFVQFKNGKG
jgi:hypothetical protein